MTNHPHDTSKKVKNIAAVLYLLALTFVVGGSYWHQQHGKPKGGDTALSPNN